MLELREQILALEQQGQGTNAAIRELNASLEEAPGRRPHPLRGTGVVFQLEDSSSRRGRSRTSSTTW